MKTALLMIALVLVPLLAFANIVLPETVEGTINWLEVFSQVIANPKAVTPTMIGSLLILAIVQVLKHPTFGKFFKNLKAKVQFMIITLLGVIYAILAKLTISTGRSSIS